MSHWKGSSAAIVAACIAAAAAHSNAQEEAAGEPNGEEILEAAREQGFFEGWTGRVELGVNGASGNTERFNLRSSVGANRLTERLDTRAAALFTYATDDGSKSESRLLGTLRNDWLFKDSPWRIFAEGSSEFDEFASWDWRLTGAAGVGYQFIKEERTSLIGRLGAGVSKEFGGPDDDWQPEGLIGLDFAHRLTDRQRITAAATYYPDLEDLEEFRFIGNAAYEILIDPESRMSLRLGVENRHDTTPGAGFKRNDLAYFATLVWEF